MEKLLLRGTSALDVGYFSVDARFVHFMHLRLFLCLLLFLRNSLHVLHANNLVCDARCCMWQCTLRFNLLIQKTPKAVGFCFNGNDNLL